MVSSILASSLFIQKIALGYTMTEKDINRDESLSKAAPEIVDHQDYQSLLHNAAKDRIYSTKEAASFAFGAEVAEVFDDMISRSVPYYLDLQLLTASIAAKFHRKGTAIYDLGCSTATALALIAKRLPEADQIIGIDNSKPMLEKAATKFNSLGITDQITLSQQSLLEVNYEPSSVVIANYMLQFLSLNDRSILLRRISESLCSEGVLLVTEKTTPYETTGFGDLIKTLHEDFKYQNGYSELEIARKRESLVGVMQPVGEQKNQLLFKEAGFKRCIELMRGYSFVTWLCAK